MWLNLCLFICELAEYCLVFIFSIIIGFHVEAVTRKLISKCNDFKKSKSFDILLNYTVNDLLEIAFAILMLAFLRIFEKFCNHAHGKIPDLTKIICSMNYSFPVGLILSSSASSRFFRTSEFTDISNIFSIYIVFYSFYETNLV